jgi:hypothetical protein
MSGFKIIAIKTGENGESPRNYLKSSNYGVDINYLKNLTPNTVFTFYNNYVFPQNDFEKISKELESNFNLYSLKLSNGIKIPININAVVGEYGSGNSTLIELIYWINYNLGCKFNLLKFKAKRGKEESYLINEQLDLELFYQVNDELHYLLKFENGNIKKLKVNFTNHHFELEKKTNWESIETIHDISDFFYSIVINYSQYALNALEVGEWINPLFHKNDGYQTPIVLNPMRNEGNININKERLLLSRRLQSNVLEEIAEGVELKNSLRNLSNEKIAEILKVTFNSNYFDKVEKEEGIIKPNYLFKIITGIEEHFDFKFIERDDNYNYFVTIVSKYIYYKLRKIVAQYKTYKDFKDGNSIKNISLLLFKIKESNSHITFKVKGAILHIKYFDKIYEHSKFNFDNSFSIDISYLSKLIYQEIKPLESFLVNTYMMALPSFFNVEVIPNKNLSLGNFSSGEKQKIFSLSSIVYHLINLNSVESSTNSFTRYKYINIILDEIEMYYHPEWQRKYISDIVKYTEKVNPDSLKDIQGINITFLTHSPFILSDIPSENILRLIDGEPQESNPNEQTFGSNIYDLLDNEFFMKDGFIGEHAMFKIKEVLDYVGGEKYDKTKHDYFLSLTNIIGDEIINQKLNQLLSDLHNNSIDDNQQKIFHLKLKQKQIEDQLKKLEK